MRPRSIHSKGPRLRRPLAVAILLAIAGAALASCASIAGAHAGATSAATVKVRSTKLGRILVDGIGRTLYLFEPDEYGRSSCYGACAAAWPPLLTSGAPHAGRAAQSAKVGTTTRRDGRLQVTYDGYPLYLFVRDTRPGQTRGQGLDGFGGGWYVLDPLGRKIENGRHGGDPAQVHVRNSSLGPVLTDRRGRTVYLFEADNRQASRCYGACAVAWPPVITNGRPRSGKGAKSSLLGTIKRRDGRLQVTYRGHPLYYFVKDSRSGQTLGHGIDGFGAEWYALRGTGAKIEKRGRGRNEDEPSPTTTVPEDDDINVGY